MSLPCSQSLSFRNSFFLLKDLLILTQAQIIYNEQRIIVFLGQFDNLLMIISGLYRDAAAGVDYLLSRKDIDHNKLVVFGRSLGGAVAIQLAASPLYSNKIHSLLVENTFTTLPDIARFIFADLKIVSYLPEWCFKNHVRQSCHQFYTIYI